MSQVYRAYRTSSQLKAVRSPAMCKVLNIILVLVAAGLVDSRAAGPLLSPAGNVYKAEHRETPAGTEVLRYYGGVQGNVLAQRPVAPRVRVESTTEENVGEEEEQGGGGGGGGDGNGEDGVSIQLPPPGASVAEVRPVGLSIAGIGGVAASKPMGTAVVGPGGLAIARPVATAIAGVPPEAVLGPGPGGVGMVNRQQAALAVGPGGNNGIAKYSIVPLRSSAIQPVFLQRQRSLQQPFLYYPIAYY